VAHGDGLEIRVAVGELRAVGVEQAKLGGEVRRIGGDNQVEMSRHGDWASLYIAPRWSAVEWFERAVSNDNSLIDNKEELGEQEG